MKKKDQKNNHPKSVTEPDLLRYDAVDPDYVPANYNDEELHTDCHHGQS